MTQFPLRPGPISLTAKDVSTIAMTTGNEKKFTQIIVKDVVLEWVGFGWIAIGEPDEEDRATLPYVAEEVERTPVNTKD